MRDAPDWASHCYGERHALRADLFLEALGELPDALNGECGMLFHADFWVWIKNENGLYSLD